MFKTETKISHICYHVKEHYSIIRKKYLNMKYQPLDIYERVYVIEIGT